MTYDIQKAFSKIRVLQNSDFIFVCKFYYLQEKFLICYYFSRKPHLHLSEKLDKKNLKILNF